MQIMSTPERWGIVARFLHWSMAAGILGLQGYGWWMTEFPERSARIGHYANHGTIAYYLGLMLLLRLLWRIMDRANPAATEAALLAEARPPSRIERWQVQAARLGHQALYLGTFLLICSGWYLHSTFPRRFEIDLFGSLRVPLLFAEGSRPLAKVAEGVHEFLANALFALILVHVAATLWHHLILRDNVLRRMWR